MTGKEHINEYFNGQPFMILCALGLMAVTAAALLMGVTPAADEASGIFFSLKGSLLGNGQLSAAINVLCLLATGGIMLALNKVFSYVREMTRLFASAFFLLQMANPSGLVAFNSGTLLCLVSALATMPLFASFQDRHSQRSIFLIFALVATGCMVHYGFLILIPAFLLGFMNMGVFNLKGVLAMLFGLITPFWIVMGLGITSPADAVAPQWLFLERVPMTPLVVLTSATAVLGIVLAAMNLHTIMNYRVQPRVYNAFFIIVLVLAIIALFLDHSHLTVYLPLLNLMVAVQVAQFHTLRTFHHRYVFILLFVASCLAFCAINLLMP